MLHFIWVSAVCKSTHLGVSRIQRVSPNIIYVTVYILQVNVELLGNNTDNIMNMEQNLWQQNVGATPAVPETVTVTLTQNPGEGKLTVLCLECGIPVILQ